MPLIFWASETKKKRWRHNLFSKRQKKLADLCEFLLVKQYYWILLLHGIYLPIMIVGHSSGKVITSVRGHIARRVLIRTYWTHWLPAMVSRMHTFTYMLPTTKLWINKYKCTRELLLRMLTTNVQRFHLNFISFLLFTMRSLSTSFSCTPSLPVLYKFLCTNFLSSRGFPISCLPIYAVTQNAY